MTATLHRLEPPAPPAKPVGAVTAALDILRCLGRHEESQRLSDIVRELGLNSSTVLNILRTLEYEGLIACDRRTKRYALDRGLADLAAPLVERHDPVRRLHRALDAAAHELSATVALWRRVGSEVELVQVAESPGVMRIAFMVGRRLPMLLGAMGRLVAARGDWTPQTLRAAFDQVRWSSTPDYAAWLDQVAEARRTNVGVDRGHVNAGVLGVAAPVEPAGPLTHIIAAAMFVTDETPGIAAIAERLRAVAAMALAADGDRHA